MKKVLLLMLVIGITFTSCSSDDPTAPNPTATPNPTPQPNPNPSPNPVDTAQEEINTLSQNTILLGAVREEGEFPAASGNIDFEILFEPLNIAPLNEGVDLVLASNVALVGAYVVLKSEDGTLSNSYFDYIFPVDAFQLEVDLDFNDAIVAGTSFCYEVAVYDASGNVSPAKEFCASVPAWGGNDDLVGNWSLQSKISTTVEGVETTVPGETNCLELTLFCDNGDEIPYESCITIDFETLTISADGTYNLQDAITSSGIDFLTASETCDVTNLELRTDNTTKTGKWTFVDGERGRLLLAQYTTTFPSFFGGEDELIIDEPGNASVVLYFVELQASNLVLTQEFYSVGETVPFETLELTYTKE